MKAAKLLRDGTFRSPNLIDNVLLGLPADYSVTSEFAKIVKTKIKNSKRRFRHHPDLFKKYTEKKVLDLNNLIESKIISWGLQYQPVAGSIHYLLEMEKFKYIALDSWELAAEIYLKEFTPVVGKRNSKAKISYEWLNDSEKDLPELYEYMKGKYISDETSLSTFIGVFTGKPLDEINPLKWHEDNASEIVYFITGLEKTHNIKDCRNERWKRLKACFVRPSGELFDADLKVLKANITKSLSSEKQNHINDLITQYCT